VIFQISNDDFENKNLTLYFDKLYSLDKAQKIKKVVLGTPKKLFKPFLALGKQLITSF